MTSQGAWERWGPLAGPAFVVLMVAGFLVSGDSPSPDDSNAKILSYLADDGNFDKNFIGFLILLVAALCALVFFGALRQRVVDAETGNGPLGSLALGAGVASVVLLVIGICAFIAPILAAHDSGANPVEPGAYRVTQALGYMLWVASAVAGALAVWATSAVTLRTGMFPRWFGWFGVVTGVIALFGIFFFPMFLYWIWIAIAGVLMLRRPLQSSAASSPMSRNSASLEGDREPAGDVPSSAL